MPIGALAIDRFRITAVIAGGHAAPDRIRAKLDAVNEGALAAALATRLGASVDAWDDDRVILLRRVVLDLSQATGVDASRLADQLAAMLAIALARAAEAPGENIVLFPSRPAFLAAFLRAAVHGEAWDKWWFERFSGLRQLTLSACLRTALARDIDEGVQALTELSTAERTRVLGALSPGDLRVLLMEIDEDAPVGDLAVALAAMTRLPSAHAFASSDHATMHFFLAGLVAAPARPRSNLLRGAELLASVQVLDGEQRGAVVRALRAGHLAPLLRALPLALVAALAPLLSLPTSARRAIAEDLHAATAPSHAPILRFTPFGGLLLLAPSLPEDCDPSLALAALSACAGPQEAAQAFADPVLQQVLGAPERHAMAGIKPALARLGDAAVAELGSLPGTRDRRWLTPPRPLRRNAKACRAIRVLAHTALRDVARRLPGFANGSSAFLWQNVLSAGAHVEREGDGFRAILERPPLDVLLSMTGLADRVAELPNGLSLRLERAR